MFSKLFAVCLLVQDFTVSLDFYQKLGLELNNQNGNFADFKLEGTSLAIFQKDDAVAMLPARFIKSGGGAVLAFQVDDIDEFCRDLKGREVEIIEGPKTTPWGQKVAYFLDPDKNVWEISEK